MEVTIENVLKLVELTHVPYGDAKAALDQADGDILEALLALEREGKIRQQSTAYDTTGGVHSGPQTGPGQGHAHGGPGHGYAHGGPGYGAPGGPGYGAPGGPGYPAPGRYGRDDSWKKNTSGFGDLLKRFFKWVGKMFHRGNMNHFEIYHHGKTVLSIPVSLLVILLIIFCWFMVPALIIALFFGCRYRFRGPDLDREPLNKAMNMASYTAEAVKKSVKEAAENVHEHSGEPPYGAASPGLNAAPFGAANPGEAPQEEASPSSGPTQESGTAAPGEQASQNPDEGKE